MVVMNKLFILDEYLFFVDKFMQRIKKTKANIYFLVD